MSEVIFSDKYAPLFEILFAWREAKLLSAIKSPTNNQKEELEYFSALSKIDTVSISGGRDSGKTFALACQIATACADYNHRVLYTRQTMASTDNSITQALEDRMALLGLDHLFSFANNNFTLSGGEEGKITITGQKTSTGTQTAKLKSLENYSMFVTEEAEELTSYSDWKKIKRSMRASDVQCLSILCFNPPTREHWIAQELYEDIPEGFNGIKNNILYIHTTYLDNGKENMAEHNWREYEELRLVYEEVLSTPVKDRDKLPYKTIKKYEEYKYSILGGFKKKAEGVIYPEFELKEFDETLPSKGHGLDFGSNDPDALVKVALDKKNKRIFLKEEYFKGDTSYETLRDILIKIAGKTESIVGDCAERRMIIDLKNAGLNITKSDKTMPVEDQIKMLLDYEFFIDPESKNLIKAFNNYKWHDKKAGVPNHSWSDLMDAWRYKAYDLINPSVGVQVIW